MKEGGVCVSWQSCDLLYQFMALQIQRSSSDWWRSLFHLYSPSPSVWVSNNILSATQTRLASLYDDPADVCYHQQHWCMTSNHLLQLSEGNPPQLNKGPWYLITRELLPGSCRLDGGVVQSVKHFHMTLLWLPISRGNTSLEGNLIIKAHYLWILSCC